jgi:glycosyltransferase involved in cell wall biosynthesis
MMAEALAVFCDRVTVLTRERPFFEQDFAAFPAHSRIDLRVRSDLALPAEAYDLVICVPSLSLDWTLYARAIEAKAAWPCHLMFIDFESPDWYNANNAVKRTRGQTLSWRLTAHLCDSIVSATRYGSEQAQRYYVSARGDRVFAIGPPSINSIAADAAPCLPKRQVICIARVSRTSPHKGVRTIRRFLCPELAGHDLVLLGKLDPAWLAELGAEAKTYGIGVTNVFNLSDADKFALIKSSDLMLFLSDFEGYGLPPLEAAYCGVPTIAKPLPVYAETLGEAVHTWREGEDPGAALIKALGSRQDPAFMAALGKAGATAAFAAYAKRLEALLAEVVTARATSPVPDSLITRLRRTVRWLPLKAVGLAASWAKGMRQRVGSGMRA